MAEFRKISNVRSMLGATTWYLSDDCLLAAKRVMYTVEYRRFYLRDLESIVVWPSRVWLLRPILPAVLLVALGAAFWHWTNLIVGAVIGGVGLAWALVEVVLGPTAVARLETTGASVDLPLVHRTRRASKVLGKIDQALRAARASAMQESHAPAAGPQSPASTTEAATETVPASSSIGNPS